jgi:GNAT superfamily N-acetyltransferase
VVIRPWEEDDLDALLALGSRFYDEAQSYRNFKFSPHKVMENFFFILERHDQVGLCYDDGEIKGAIAGAIYPQFFSKGLTASELFLFVDHGARGGVIGKRLVNAFENWAMAMGANEIRVGVSSGIKQERTIGLYEKLGYTSTATQLRKVL